MENQIGIVLAIVGIALWTWAATLDNQCCAGFGLIVVALVWLAFLDMAALGGHPEIYGHPLRPWVHRSFLLIAPILIIRRKLAERWKIMNERRSN